MQYVIFFDIGSTYVKAVVLCLSNNQLIFTTRSPSLIGSAPYRGVEACLTRIRTVIGNQATDRAYRMASSSAAGGLQMIVVGLTQRFSLSAGQNAAFGAGAKILATYTRLLSQADVDSIAKQSADIILLCGGLDGGADNLILNNAEMLAKNPFIQSTVVFAGNDIISQPVRRCFAQYQKQCLLADNILPCSDKLNLTSANDIIRELFIRQIADIKGLRQVRNLLSDDIVPTPAAVLAAGSLLAKGTTQSPGLGDLLMVDVGGATTDVYSFIDAGKGNGSQGRAPDPYAKRTVEGDIGVRSSIKSLVNTEGATKIAGSAGVSIEILNNYIDKCETDVSTLPESPQEWKVDSQLAKAAVRIATRRHAGSMVTQYEGHAITKLIGRDLTAVSTIIGTGGSVISAKEPKEILTATFKSSTETFLLPTQATFRVDAKYMLFAMGLWAAKDNEKALNIMKREL